MPCREKSNEYSCLPYQFTTVKISSLCHLGHSYSSVNLTYLPLEVDVCSLQNQFPHTVYVTGIGGDHEERGAVLDGGQTDKG